MAVGGLTCPSRSMGWNGIAPSRSMGWNGIGWVHARSHPLRTPHQRWGWGNGRGGLLSPQPPSKMGMASRTPIIPPIAPPPSLIDGGIDGVRVGRMGWLRLDGNGGWIWMDGRAVPIPHHSPHQRWGGWAEGRTDGWGG